MSKRNKLITFAQDQPKTQTRHLEDYLNGDPTARAAASEGIFEQCRPLIDTITREVLQLRFRELTGEIIQEAWGDCLEELQKRSDEFLKSRGERPAFRELVVGVTMRTVWRLEKRARVQVQREVSLDAALTAAGEPKPPSKPSAPSAGATRSPARAQDSWDPEPDELSTLSVADFHRIFTLSWEQLLQESTAEDQQVLNDIGSLAFFADDWVSLAAGSADVAGAPRTMTRVVLERRQRVRWLIDVILDLDHHLDARSRRRFLDVLVPVPKT